MTETRDYTLEILEEELIIQPWETTSSPLPHFTPDETLVRLRSILTEQGTIAQEKHRNVLVKATEEQIRSIRENARGLPLSIAH